PQIDNAAFVSHTFPAYGTYTVRLTAVVCSDTSVVEQEVGVFPVGIYYNATAAMPIKVYPNPAKDFVQVEVLPTYDGAYFTLYAIDGKKCLERSLAIGSNLLQIADLPSGIYYYTIKSNKQVIQQHKIVLLK
ncbi:MAG: T9SS type A sorting domain-containing protein, partial [Chitinophagales bacterium]|nr:T9SS type A sorting domain-containing protein [Chitinophagales bacterium]